MALKKIGIFYVLSHFCYISHKCPENSQIYFQLNEFKIQVNAYMTLQFKIWRWIKHHEGNYLLWKRSMSVLLWTYWIRALFFLKLTASGLTSTCVMWKKQRCKTSRVGTHVPSSFPLMEHDSCYTTLPHKLINEQLNALIKKKTFAREQVLLMTCNSTVK